MNISNESQVASMLEHISYDYIGPAICVFGILCNILNLLILTEHYLKESPYSYLTAMASVDLGALALTFIYFVFARNRPFSYYWRFFEAHLYYPLVNICSNSSVWLIVMLTIERFLFVCYPIWAKIHCSRTGANVKVAIIITCIGIINIPRFLAFRVEYKFNPDDPKYYLYSTDFRKTQLFSIINWFYSIIINFIPLTVLCISNVYLVYAVQRAKRQRQVLHIRNNKEATWNREQMRLTITLISIVCLFIICVMPSAFADRPSAYALFGNGRPIDEFLRSTPYRILQMISNMLICCNLSLNFVLYCAFNNKFVRVFKMMLNRWRKSLRKNSNGKQFQKVRVKKTALNGNISLSSTAASSQSLSQPSRMTTMA
ncbi:probable G-protein coupled receptor B0563.6 [Haliotis rufescens]|uniref:probable G-protein coupled receptor B0563.6 n=1 Tax=Haliotis rufescens TaxID=6454 RepID=UPI00201F273A|nr:probable G-protein coupled receptor B0563.6 [Haliotis rufescens]